MLYYKEKQNGSVSLHVSFCNIKHTVWFCIIIIFSFTFLIILSDDDVNMELKHDIRVFLYLKSIKAY